MVMMVVTKESKLFTWFHYIVIIITSYKCYPLWHFLYYIGIHNRYVENTFGS